MEWAFSRRRARARCRSRCGRVACVSGGGRGGAASSTAVLQTVFALVMQVFVVRIHRTACALVAVKVLIWLFAFRLDAGTDLFGGFLVSWTQEWEWSWWRNHRQRGCVADLLVILAVVRSGFLGSSPRRQLFCDCGGGCCGRCLCWCC